MVLRLKGQRSRLGLGLGLLQQFDVGSNLLLVVRLACIRCGGDTDSSDRHERQRAVLQRASVHSACA